MILLERFRGENGWRSVILASKKGCTITKNFKLTSKSGLSANRQFKEPLVVIVSAYSTQSVLVYFRFILLMCPLMMFLRKNSPQELVTIFLFKHHIALSPVLNDFKHPWFVACALLIHFYRDGDPAITAIKTMTTRYPQLPSSSPHSPPPS